ncbi:MAG: cytochrome c family protein [Devosia sp.]|uniref:c-type cytochrome n=1 Tax=Devosia sp. TaxID=1871048 RepID=UPI0024C8AC97|nr:cytochrome c family protein [Devosia sp.]UYO00720.1 MAG: cytochrome c family protein [Devosia sp.]
MQRIAGILFVFLWAVTAVPAQESVERGAALFPRCEPCHAIGPDPVDRIGPHLNGVVGRPIAGLPDYSYSRTLRTAGDAGLVWDRATLTRYLKNPRHSFPGTSMAFAGMRVRADIDAMVDYLESFDTDGATAPQ